MLCSRGVGRVGGGIRRIREGGRADNGAAGGGFGLRGGADPVGRLPTTASPWCRATRVWRRRRCTSLSSRCPARWPRCCGVCSSARRPLCWGRPATPKRLAAAVIAAAVLAVLLEGGTLVGGPVSSPLVASDWHASRMAAFFVLCLPALCCIVLYDWRALARRWRAAVVACGFRLPKLFAAWLLAAVAAGLLAALAGQLPARRQASALPVPIRRSPSCWRPWPWCSWACAAAWPTAPNGGFSP